jgi:hypothetical protein
MAKINNRIIEEYVVVACSKVFIWVEVFGETKPNFISNTVVPVTVAQRSKACTVFARSEAGIVGSNSTQGMDVWCVYTFILFVLSCV